MRGVGGSIGGDGTTVERGLLALRTLSVHNSAMLVRWISALLLAVVGIIPVLPDAFVLATTKPARHTIIRRVPMSYAERMKDDSQCHPSASHAAALLPGLAVDVPPAGCQSAQPTTNDATSPRLHFNISHSPELPASHRIRAP